MVIATTLRSVAYMFIYQLSIIYYHHCYYYSRYYYCYYHYYCYFNKQLYARQFKAMSINYVYLSHPLLLLIIAWIPIYVLLNM
jgi:hypothetical protein